MDKISKIIIAGILSLFLALSTVSLTSCAMLEGAQDVVVTTSDNIKPESKDLVLRPGKDIMKTIPQDVQDKLKASGKEIVLAYPEDVVDASRGVQVSNPGSNGWQDLLNLGLGVAGSIFPGVGALTAVQVFFSRRARTHLGEAVQAVNPMNGGTVDVGQAVLSVARAYGLAHSSEDSKAAFEGTGSAPSEAGSGLIKG